MAKESDNSLIHSQERQLGRFTGQFKKQFNSLIAMYDPLLMLASATVQVIVSPLSKLEVVIGIGFLKKEIKAGSQTVFVLFQ